MNSLLIDSSVKISDYFLTCPEFSKDISSTSRNPYWMAEILKGRIKGQIQIVMSESSPDLSMFDKLFNKCHEEIYSVK
ncbi:hypothetical protein [Erwinia phage FBB1]|nr:hypothetical protein [Erwinia phage FBB1]